MGRLIDTWWTGYGMRVRPRIARNASGIGDLHPSEATFLAADVVQVFR